MGDQLTSSTYAILALPVTNYTIGYIPIKQ